jgi:hypothetical protein
MQAEFLGEAILVALDRFRAEREPAGDGLVGVTPGDEAEHGLFLPGQADRSYDARAGWAVIAQQRSRREPAVEVGPAGHDLADGFEQFFAGRFLEDETNGFGLDQLAQVNFVAVCSGRSP